MSSPYGLFERFGVELEYMIVARDDLRVLPLCDRVLHGVCGAYESEVEMGALRWSNELVLHVIEFKTNGPVATLEGLAQQFQHDIQRVNEALEPLQAWLMPTAMHPWMNPDTETRLWPHEYNAVYEAFNRIFDCRGHGWANLQATHLNLPFANDEEFGRLHAAIRLLLPILPALAASSPVVAGRRHETADARLEYYRNNARRIPSVAGRIVPEPVFTIADYHREILAPLYRDITPHDPNGILQKEWLNARGAIARFDRNAIEIRLLDIQECPAADLAILALIVSVLQALVREEWTSLAKQQSWPVAPLEEILLETIRHGDEALIRDSRYLQAFGCALPTPCCGGDLWADLYTRALPAPWKEQFGHPLRLIRDQGTLSRRIVQTLGPSNTQPNIAAIYRELCRCAAEGCCFDARAFGTADRPPSQFEPLIAREGPANPVHRPSADES